MTHFGIELLLKLNLIYKQCYYNRSISENCLLTAFKVLLNLTHEFQLGCYRLGEQKGIMTILLSVLFQVSLVCDIHSQHFIFILILSAI